MPEETERRWGERGEGWVIAQFGLLAAIGLAPLRLPPLRSLPEPAIVGLQWLGGLTALLGASLGLAAAWHLGPNLTPLPRPKPTGQLVQSGVYGLVRHPIYTSLILLSLAWAMFRAHLPTFLLVVLLGFFFDRKASREEGWLTDRFSAYAEYRQRVRKLLPGVY